METIVTPSIQSVFNKASLSKPRTEVPNSHKAVASELERFQNYASQLGINFEDTEYTLVISKKPTELEPKIYSAFVGTNAATGEASIYWGKVVHPLSSVKVSYDIAEENKRISMVFFLKGKKYLSLPLMLPKDSKLTVTQLKAEMIEGTLGEVLGAGFVKPSALSSLEPGEYSVIGYEKSEFKGEEKFSVILDGLGKYKANFKLSQKLREQPVITKEQPATMTVYPVTSQTAMGYPIVPVTLSTFSDRDIPVYSFDDDEVSVFNPKDADISF